MNHDENVCYRLIGQNTYHGFLAGLHWHFCPLPEAGYWAKCKFSDNNSSINYPKLLHQQASNATHFEWTSKCGKVSCGWKFMNSPTVERIHLHSFQPTNKNFSRGLSAYNKWNICLCAGPLKSSYGAELTKQYSFFLSPCLFPLSSSFNIHSTLSWFFQNSFHLYPLVKQRGDKE